MRIEMKIGLLVAGLLLLGSSAMADKVASRPTSNYGQGNPLGGPLLFEEDTGFIMNGLEFQEQIICSTSGNASCIGNTATDGSDYALVLDISPLGQGPFGSVVVTLPGFTTGLDFGQVICGFTTDGLGNTVPTNDISCGDAINTKCDAALASLTSNNGSFAIPSDCVSPGAVLFFDFSSASDAPGFAGITSGSTATPEPSSALLLAMGLIPLGILSKRLMRG